jgi:hypothetical protein
MSLANFVFTETSPGAGGTAASSAPVQNAASYLPAGVCGPCDEYDAVDVIAELQGKSAGGTNIGDTLDVYVQTSPDGGINWYDIIHFPQLASGASVKYYQAPISNATTTTSPTLVGKGLSPALSSGVMNSGSVVNGAFSDRMRLVMVAGPATAVGAPVIVRVVPQRSAVKMGK